MTEKEFYAAYEGIEGAYDRLKQLIFCQKTDKRLTQGGKEIERALDIMKPDMNALITEVPFPNKRTRERIANHLENATEYLDEYGENVYEGTGDYSEILEISHDLKIDLETIKGDA